jgi:hypothetical protein
MSPARSGSSTTLRHLKDVERLLRGNALNAIVADPSDPRSLAHPKMQLRRACFFYTSNSKVALQPVAALA